MNCSARNAQRVAAIRKEHQMTNATKSLPNSPSPSNGGVVRSLLGNRRWQLLALGAILLGLGLFFKWDWLAAVGVTPVLISLLPCAAMCALGLCMSKMGGASTSPPQGSNATDAESNTSANEDSRSNA
jgi:hypothetical protein